MASMFWVAIMVIVATSIICGTIVKLVKVAKSSGGSKFSDRVEDLEEELHDLRAELDDARGREVLEKIVTDSKYDLRQQIDDLASNE